MGSVWKRLQRVNKRAAKFQFTVSYHEMQVETTAKWRPTSLSVIWTRRSRRVHSSPLAWDPDMVDPLTGTMEWPVSDNHTISVTLFKDPRTHELEDKDWQFVLEDVSQLGKKRALATCAINMRKYASVESTQQTFQLALRPCSKKIQGARLELTISCVFLREGKATDEDMQSMASLMSCNTSDIAPLDDLEDIPDLESSGDISEHVLDFTQQLEQLTESLNSSELQTPISVPSIPEDPTPLAEFNELKEDEVLEKPDKLDKIDKIDKTDKIDAFDKIERNNFKDKCDIEELPRPPTPPPVLVVSCEVHIERMETKKVEDRVTEMDTTLCIEEETPAPPKPRDDKKRQELQPLNLKKSYDFNATLNLDNKAPLKDKTPGQDLLEWCKDVTKNYEAVKVTNLTTSWRNGMAFCAVIHHFRPELIDMDKLLPSDVLGNCRMAFDTAEKLGIPRVIEPSDMIMLAVPDKLRVMTYLYQLHTLFTGRQLEVERIGKTADDSSYYVIGNYKSDSHATVDSLHDIKQQLLQQRANYMLEPKSPGVKTLLLNGSKQLLDKVLSPAKESKEKGSPVQEKPLLMTRRQYADPMGLWDEEEEKGQAEEPAQPVLDVETANKLVNRHKEMTEKAKIMIEKLRVGTENGKSLDIDENERQTRLREHARRLIAETRAKSTVDSPSSPVRSITQRITLSPERTISPINNNTFNFNNNHQEAPPIRGKSPTLQSFTNVMDRLSPKGENKLDKTSYIQSEMVALEREQEAIDLKANVLEKKLRAVMGGVTDAESEDQLMAQWFTLVNKKNALLRRQMQLNILEKESDLERKYDMLNLELRAALSVEDWRKTEEQRDREALLLAELVAIVDKRNELVQHLHNQEQAIEDDDEIERKLVNVDINHKEKCVIQ